MKLVNHVSSATENCVDIVWRSVYNVVSFTYVHRALWRCSFLPAPNLEICKPSVPGMMILQPVVVRYYLAFLPKIRFQTNWRHWKNNCRMLPRVAGGVGLLLLEESDESTEICFLRRNDSLGSDRVRVRSSSRTGEGPPSVVDLSLLS